MKVAFYAPMKSPRHARPSGDRRIAQAFMRALATAGMEVELADELRAWEGDGDAEQQSRIAARGERAAARLIAAYQKRPAADRPDCWLTYHCYHKAPDWIGATVSNALGIPYALAEASLARKQIDGAWQSGYAQSLAAVQHARVIFNINSNDLAGLHSVARDGALVKMKPFLDMPAESPSPIHSRIKKNFSRDPNIFHLLCVAMMRDGDKLKSYRILAEALAQMQRRDWRLLIAGDGPAEARVREEFSGRGLDQVYFLGRCAREEIYPLMRACDLLVWPAHNEAFGMAVLEAHACGLPVVAGRSGGIGDIVVHGVTGILTAPGDASDMARGVEQLLSAPAKLKKMAAASKETFDRHHRLDTAAKIIGDALARIVARA